MAGRRRGFSVEPLTPERWGDFVALFGENGACGGCWCLTPKLAAKEYEASKGAGNRRKQKRFVDGGGVPGLLGYRDGEPVAWVAIEPREAYGRLARSRVLAPVDDAPVWSIVCFFVRKDARGGGVSVRMIDAAVRWARENGATCVEGYPVEPKAPGEAMPPVFAWTGLASAFRRAGFDEVARRSPTRPIFRRRVRPARRRIG